MSAWIATSEHLPAEGVAVETKIDGERGARNHAILIRAGALWFFADGSMYVYYRPTHWREVHP